ncbi:KAP family P-loop NTPase fold protein [Actinokineospora diospyrosa]|uniref:KAP family P-loop domain-containing protein n=1 Tax=Actinokineospora diospyrosa TaxID=103728 RepID=A0ABT1I5N7_9PSEU|nr:P-loop NTPase fold protein [Actinokineospora diospyrosa]MCP2267933.1 KAP family P-loop domain-containing protein [Actinokineospora diospyrosa]
MTTSLNPARMALWDDNPSAVDLLGFDTVVAAVEGALAVEGLDPLTIGIHAPWGGGKTSVLGMVEERLKGHSGYVVVRTDPWEYDDHDDVRGTLIAEVLHELEKKFKGDGEVGAKVKDLVKRVSWSRVTKAVAKGAITMQWDPVEVIEAFKPKARETPESMSGFRPAFANFLKDNLPQVKRVIVLVDDLDRCLPDAAMATLEAIKLFLSVPKMTFVLAADQEMVRDAIAASLDASGRSEIFANRYLEKIVQLPISLARLTADETSNYVALLLAAGSSPNNETYTSLVEHCRARRQAGQTPLLADLDRLAWRPDESLLKLADQIATGLASDKASNPRHVKRFLNAFGVRNQIAMTQGLTIAPAVLAKLYLLEDRFLNEFEHLVSLSEAERQELIAEWEEWGRRETEDRPGKVSEETRDWAAAEPWLAAEPLAPYLTLAASLTSLVAGANLTDEQAQLVADLSSPTETIRTDALGRIEGKALPEQRAVVAGLFGRVRKLETIVDLVSSLVEMAKARPELADEIADGIRQSCWHRLELRNALELAESTVPVLSGLADQLETDESVDPAVREAVRIARGQ